LNSAVLCVYLCLFRADVASVDNGEIEMNLGSVMSHGGQVFAKTVTVSFAGLGHQVRDKDLGSAGHANLIGYARYQQIRDDARVQRSRPDGDYVGTANSCQCFRQRV